MMKSINMEKLQFNPKEFKWLPLQLFITNRLWQSFELPPRLGYLTFRMDNVYFQSKLAKLLHCFRIQLQLRAQHTINQVILEDNPPCQN